MQGLKLMLSSELNQKTGQGSVQVALEKSNYQLIPTSIPSGQFIKLLINGTLEVINLNDQMQWLF